MLFYINNGKEKEGPYPAEYLSERKITKDTLVWAEGYPDWLPAGDIPELALLLKDVSPSFKSFGTDTGPDAANAAKERRQNANAVYWTVVLIAAVVLIILFAKRYL